MGCQHTRHGGGWSDSEGVIYRPPTLTYEDCISPNGHLMTTAELTNRLRLLAGYHLGIDLVERLTAAERFQREQREALAMAADRIEQLQAELAKLRAETHQTAHLCG